MQGSVAHRVPRADSLPPLLRLCRLPRDLRNEVLQGGRSTAKRAVEVGNALLDLAMATVAIRRAHRVGLKDAERHRYFHHYTRAETFDILFPKEGAKADSKVHRQLLLSPTESLNDPNEGGHFFKNLGRREGVKPLVDRVLHYRKYRGLTQDHQLVFTASLCIEEDNLNLWRFYGDAKGVSFGIFYRSFDVSSEEGIHEPNEKERLYFIRYGDQAVLNAANHVLPALQHLSQLYLDPRYAQFHDHLIRAVTDVLTTVAYLFKIDAYSAERECRVLCVLSVADVSGEESGTIKVPTIGRYPRVVSRVELVHPNNPEQPLLYLGPQFGDPSSNWVWYETIKRIRVALRERDPCVIKSAHEHGQP